MVEDVKSNADSFVSNDQKRLETGALRPSREALMEDTQQFALQTGTDLLASATPPRPVLHQRQEHSLLKPLHYLLAVHLGHSLTGATGVALTR
jgi:hypothetical protein